MIDLVIDHLPGLGLLLAVLLGGAAVLWRRKPRARPSTPDPELQATADRAERAASERRGAEIEEIEDEAATILAEPDPRERARRAARMRG